MIAILAFLLGIGLSPIVENVPGVKQVQALVRRGVQEVVVGIFGPRA
jgi:hypothetical protein